MTRVIVALILVVSLVLLAGCAAGANPTIGTPSEGGKVAGFWLGLWHGIIAPITFIISLFNHAVNLYEVHNNGGWYNFGFVLGLSISFGASGRGSHSIKRKKVVVVEQTEV